MSEQEILRILETKGAITRNGHFQLVSRNHSDSYVNMKGALNSQDFRSKIGKELAAKFQRDKINAVVGFTERGYKIAQIVTEYLQAKAVNIKIVKDDLYIDPSSKIVKGDNILILDDVVTTGSSIHETIRVIRKKNVGKVVGVGVVVDRSIKKLRFGVKFERLVRIEMNLWTKGSCPKCKAGEEYIDLSMRPPYLPRRPKAGHSFLTDS